LTVGTNITPVTTNGELRAAGNITAYYSSDRRLKENIQNIENPLQKINKINGVNFDWTQKYIDDHGGEDPIYNRKKDVGIIAQEIEEVMPEVVAERSDGYKAVRYEKIVALLIEGIKDLNGQVDKLTKEVNYLKNK